MVEQEVPARDYGQGSSGTYNHRPDPLGYCDVEVTMKSQAENCPLVGGVSCCADCNSCQVAAVNPCTECDTFLCSECPLTVEGPMPALPGEGPEHYGGHYAK